MKKRKCVAFSVLMMYVFMSQGCDVGTHFGCVDAHWGNHGLFATDTGNDLNLTLASCAGIFYINMPCSSASRMNE